MSSVNPNNKIIYPELSYQIMNLVFEIHNTIGPGFTEDNYEEALIYELGKCGIFYERQKPIEVFYKGQNWVITGSILSSITK